MRRTAWRTSWRGRSAELLRARLSLRDVCSLFYRCGRRPSTTRTARRPRPPARHFRDTSLPRGPDPPPLSSGLATLLLCLAAKVQLSEQLKKAGDADGAQRCVCRLIQTRLGSV